MPNAHGSRAVALLLVAAMVAGLFVSTAAARPLDDIVVTAPIAPSSSALVSPVTDSDLTSTGDTPEASSSESPTNLMGKIAPDLQDAAFDPQKGLVPVIIHTDNVPALGKALEALGARVVANVDGEIRDRPFVARAWGAVGTPTSIQVQLPQSALVEVAKLPYVLYVDTKSVGTTMLPEDPASTEERDAFLAFKDRLSTQEKFAAGPMSSGGAGVSPTSWAVAREHKAYDAWQLGFQGTGVNVAIVDTGEDLSHPALEGRYAVEQNPASPWYGSPIMFHPASMEGLMGNGWWTASSDLDRLPLPFWLSANDGDSWYSNTDYRANDSNLDGYLTYAHLTPDPLTGNLQYTPRANPQQYGNWGANYNTRISRDYYVGCAGLPGACVASASGIYRLGVNRDDTLTGLWGQKVGILVVDSTTPYVYDTVYVDLNFNFDFTDDKPLTQADPVANADIYDEVAGGPGQDGVADISGGTLYFIGWSAQVAGEVVTASTTGAETTLNLAKWWDYDADGIMDGTGVATDMTGWFTFDPPVSLYIDNGGAPMLVPGATEDLYEEYTGTGSELGTRWYLGGLGTTFGPVNVINGAPAPAMGTLLRGPGPDYGASYVYDIEGPAGPLTQGVEYDFDAATGAITWLTNWNAGDTIFIIYQLDTYTVEPVSGTLNLQAPLPAGWRVTADYQYGLPIPYSQVYGPAHGYDTFIPANGDLVAFHGEFDYGQSHGSFVSSTVAARPFGNLIDTSLEVFGTAPDARIIGIAACCNVPGPVGLFGSIEDQRTFAAVGYDGVPNSGDEAAIMSNSFGDPGTHQTGFSWEDRWLIDFWYRYPYTTPLIALGNNGPGYATSAPGGSSPGVIGVGAGTSQDYRILFGFDGGNGYWELPDCTGAGVPPDPALCTGFGGVGGPGPYGDHIYFSSRGPTLLGTPKPDIVSIGGYAVEAGPMNVFGSVPGDLDGNLAFDIFSGTSQATPVTAGVTALVVQAYRTAHGANPTNAQVKALLKSGADDMHRDVLQQGAGWTNALRSVKSALDTAAYVGTGDGITSDTDYWVPGNYQGTHRLGFVNFVAGGSGDSTTISLTNRNPGLAKTVQVSDAVYSLAAPAYRYSFSLATGTSQFLILKSDGVYDATGANQLAAFPWTAYWNGADFVKATFTYDAVAFTGATSWRLDTFDWYDQNTDGVYAGFGERSRMTVAVNGGNANSVWETIYWPGARIHDGWVLNPRGGAGAAIPATLIVEFYQKTDWSWVTTSVTSLNIAALVSQPVTVTLSVPTGTPAGYYEGAVYVRDGANTLTIPIVVNVPSSGFPILLGGNAPTTSLYDSNGVIQGSRSTAPWRQTGDSRYVWGTINVAPSTHPNLGRKMIYNAILQGQKSDPEMYVYNMVADPDWTDDAIYGPGTMALLAKTREQVGVTTTLYPNREIMASNPVSGLIAFQLKSWSSLAETEQLEANIGIMDTTPITASVATNRYVGKVPIAVISNVPLYDGLDTAATATTPTTLPGQVVNQDDPNNFWTASYVQTRILVGAISWNVCIDGDAPNDLDLFLVRETAPPAGPNAGDTVVGSSATGAPDECTGVNLPPDGTYYILVHGWSVPSGSTTFTLSEQLTVVAPNPNFSDTDCPQATVAPNTATGCNIEWRFPGDQAAGTYPGFLFISPRYAPYALVQLLGVTVRLDFTPPTINPARDLSPVPSSFINEPAASVVANIADSAAQIDRYSVQLIVDGRDVTSTSKVLAPYTNGYPLVTVAWEHAGAPFTDGPHSAVVNVKDFAGNLRTEVWAWTVDTTGPSLAIVDPSSDVTTNANAWTLVAQTDPGATVVVTLNAVPQTASVSPEGRITSTLDITNDGTYVVGVTVADALGNEQTMSRTIVSDGTSPVITAGIDVPTPTNARSTTVAGTVDEAVSEVFVNGGRVAVAADGSFTALVPLAEGSNSIVVTTVDAAGNTGTRTLGPIVRDTVAPSIAVDPLDAVITSLDRSSITVNGTASDDVRLFFVTINGQAATLNLTTGRFTATFPLAVGDNTFVIQAQDDAGNVATTVASVSYSPTVPHYVNNYNSLIASGVAVVLLIVGFVVGWLLAGRGGGAAAAPAPPRMSREEPRAEEELPREEPRKTEEEEL